MGTWNLLKTDWLASHRASTKTLERGQKMSGAPSKTFPTAAGIFFGMGLGGFFDGIVLHQVLQWHHLLSHDHPPVDLLSLQLNTFWDGIFHAGTYVFVLIGLVLLWRTAHRAHLWWSGKLLVGTFLIGFGAFNVLEGLINHHLLQLHHVNELVAQDRWIVWDVAFLAWGGVMLVGGWGLWRSGIRHSPSERSSS